MDRLSIQQLREKGKDPKFCSSVTEEKFDRIVNLALTRQNANYEEATDLLATISNILLVNRKLHSSYFTPYYSNKLLKFLVNFIDLPYQELESKNHGGELTFDFKSLVPVYRSIFLILYDGMANESSDLLDKTQEVLVKGFNFCFDQFEKFRHNIFYQMAYTEILKSFYTLHHRYKEHLAISEDLSVNSIIIINHILERGSKKLSKNEFLLGKSLLNFLLNINYQIKLNQREYFDIYKMFFNNLVVLLEYKLNLYFEDPTNDSSDLINLLAILSHLLTQLNSQDKDHNLLTFRNILADNILPFHKSSLTYHQCLRILSQTSCTLSNYQSFSSFQYPMHLKNLILECFFKLCWSKDKNEQIKKFLDLVGYILAKDYFDNNGLSLPDDIDLNNCLQPKYLNEDIMMSEENVFSQTLKTILNKSESTTTNELTDEEKEIEAEKLFTLFDRMEKTGLFQNFKNPIREWQQSGKFESLPSKDDDNA